VFILDTNVVSSLRRPERAPQVDMWAMQHERFGLKISVMTLGEIQTGIAAQEKRDPAFAADLQRWFETVERQYVEDILPVTEEDAKVWGRVCWTVGNRSLDLLIAAQALVRDWTVATRNVAHFEPTGARVINPFEPT